MIRFLTITLVVLATPLATVEAQNQCFPPASFPPPMTGPAFVDKDGDAITYEKLAAALLASPNETVKVVECPNSGDECLVVSMMTCTTPNSSECAATVQPGRTSRCQATDEFSQVGVVLAMGQDQVSAQRFKAWFHTTRELRNLTGNPNTLPGWLSRVEWDNGVSMPKAAITVTQFDDASDGNIRMALALYLAANSASPWIAAADRVLYRQAANELALQIRQADFIHRHRDVRGGVDEWLASGRKAAANNDRVWCDSPNPSDCGGVSFAGYHGDAMILMLAAYASTCDATYLNFVTGAMQSYLYASNYGSTFAVPPKEYAWWRNPSLPESDPSFVPLCRNTCAQAECTGEGPNQEVIPRWDDRDAVRAVTVCKAAYYYARLGLQIPGDLDDYCEDWVGTGALNPVGSDPAYVKVYAINGTLCETDPNTLKSYFNNALGTSINFFCAAGQLESRMRASLKSFDTSPLRLDPACASVYEPAMAIMNYGTFLGRDLGAFMSQTPAAPTLIVQGKPGSVELTWSGSCGAGTYEVWRRANSGGYVPLATVSETTYVDHAVDGTTALDGTTAYVYRVRAGATGPFSNEDMAIAATFTDDPLGTTTPIKAAHVLELRQAVLAAEAAAGLSSPAFSNPTLGPGVPVKALHVSELRSRLAAARAALGLPPLVYSNPANAGTRVGVTDPSELRNGVR